MNFLLRYNVLHIVILLVLNFIGLYVMPILINDRLNCFVITTIYFIIVNLSMIFWVCKFGIASKYSIGKVIKPLNQFNDYLLIVVIFIGSFISVYLLSIAQRYHLFDFLATNLQKPLITPYINDAKRLRILVTFLMISSTIILVVSEELFFRAYLFERQFLYMGRFTWLLNGFFWTVYHLFAKSNLIEFLPMALLYSFAYQKKRNLIITLIAHLMINLISVSRFIFPLYI